MAVSSPGWRILLALATSSLPALALAAEKLPLAPDPPGKWRQMDYAQNPKQFTCKSSDALKPICAIELLMACEIRSDDTDDCKRVHYFRRHQPSLSPPNKGSRGGRIYFRVELVRLIDDRDVWHEKRFDQKADEEPHGVRIGDLLVIVREASCKAPCRPYRGMLMPYRLRKVEGRWESLPFRGEHLYWEEDEINARK